MIPTTLGEYSAPRIIKEATASSLRSGLNFCCLFGHHSCFFQSCAACCHFLGRLRRCSISWYCQWAPADNIRWFLQTNLWNICMDRPPCLGPAFAKHPCWTSGWCSMLKFDSGTIIIKLYSRYSLYVELLHMLMPLRGLWGTRVAWAKCFVSGLQGYPFLPSTTHLSPWSIWICSAHSLCWAGSSSAYSRYFTNISAYSSA